MSYRRPIPDPPPTLEEYRKMEAAGEITRPLTDDPIQVAHDPATPETPQSVIDKYVVDL
jgi:BarA-like signal transduction histidine kinase